MHALLILAIEEGRLRYFMATAKCHPAGGSKSRLADQQALTACVRECGAQSGSEALRVGGRDGGGNRRQQRRRITTAAALYEFGRPRAVTLDDMAYAVERSEQVRLEEDRMILHLFPQDFTLDGRSGKRYPRGSTCARAWRRTFTLSPSPSRSTIRFGRRA